MTNYITKRIQVNFRCIFKGTLAYHVSGQKSNPGLLLIFMEIMPEKVIFFTYDQFLLKIEKKKIFKLTIYDFLWFKITLSGIISTKTTKSPKSPGKYSEVRTEF